MISRRELERLASMRSDKAIVSAYIKIDPRLGYDPNQPIAKFKGACKRFARQADERARRALRREEENILMFLEEWKPHGRALVIFACRPDDIWETVELDVMVPTFVSVDTTTHTSLLARVIDEYPRMAVALLDGDTARVYLSEQGREEQLATVSSDIPGRHDQGGWSQARFQRHIEFHGAKHLQKVAELIERLYYEQPFQRLVLVGIHETVSEIKRMLSEPVRRRVIGDFSVDFKKENDEEVMERARRLAEEQERATEKALVRSVIDGAQAGGQATVGMEPTIDAVSQGRVRTLVVADGVTKDGSLCENCGFFAPRRFEACPVCSGRTERLTDVVEYATEQAYLSGADVNTVFGEAKEALVARGGIGATLRY